MHIKSKQNLIIMIISLCLAVTVIVTVTFAWFAIRDGGNVLVVVGDINANVNLYYGNDENNDGLLDDSGGNAPYSSRIDVIENYYTEFAHSPQSVSSLIFSDISFGKCLVYKLVIENPSTNNFPISVSVNTSNLFNYFYDQLDEFALAETNSVGSYSFSYTEIQKYIARLLLCFDSMSYQLYECGENDQEYLTEHGTKTNIFDAQTDYFLWNYSNGEKFIENIIVPSGNLVEIDFRIKYVYNSQNMTNYMMSISDSNSNCSNTCKQKLVGLGYSELQASSLAEAYIQQMCQEEQAILSATSDYALLELNLNIDYVEVTLLQQ